MYGWWHWQNLNEDEAGSAEGRPPTKGRAWFHMSPGERDVEKSPYGVDLPGRSVRLLGGKGACFGVEWTFPSTRFALGFDVERMGEDDVKLRLCVPPVGLYLSAKAMPLARLAEWLFVLEASDMWNGENPGYERKTSLHVFEWAVWWKLWVDGHGWTSTRPRWRDGNFHFLDALLGKQKMVKVPFGEGPVDVVVPMPEGTYAGKVQFTRSEWRRPRWPWPVHKGVFANVEMVDPVPVPGKGENSWDCGEDALHGLSCRVEAPKPEQAVARVVEAALRTRRQYGGARWRPEAKAG